MNLEKEYRFAVRLGVETTTLDAEGEVVREAPVPPFSIEEIRAAAAPFTGEYRMTPPAYSALKRGGKRIVLELGDAACAECAVLDERIEGEAPLRHRRDAGFIWVKVDRSAPGNVAFLAAYPGSAEAHAPHLLVLDADGQVLHAQSGHDLLRKGKPDRRRIEAFLEEWAPPEAPAQP